MKIRTLHRIFALSMAFLMLGVSAGFSADFHYCQGEFKNFALYKKAKSCHELASMKASCHTKSDSEKTCHSAKIKCDSEEENGCCNNNTKLVQLDLDYAFGAFQITTTDFSPNYFTVVGQVIPDLRRINKEKIQYLNYKPPLIVTEKTILFQSFLC